MPDTFNLVDEPWFPLAGEGRASLQDLFSRPAAKAIGGNPVEKIALTKFLLAIAQAACTPETEDDYRALTPKKMAERCLSYLKQHKDLFDLYGDKPFLQIPAVKAARVAPFGAVLPDVSTGNTTILTQSQVERPLDDPQRAVLLICLMGFALGGKKTDNEVVISPGYLGKTKPNGKPTTGKPGPSVDFLGTLHSFIFAKTLWESLYLNLWSNQKIAACGMFPAGLGTAPWEEMPAGEACPTAQRLTQSLFGRLLPLARFCLFSEHGLHYSEGIAHPNYKAGVADPTASVQMVVDGAQVKNPRMVWVDPDKRPWRELTALLSFIAPDRTAMTCLQVQMALQRSQGAAITLWSGGLRVSSNAGEQYVSGADDFVESEVILPEGILGTEGFTQFKVQMGILEQMAKTVYGAVSRYCVKFQIRDGKSPAQASQLFWELAERQAQDLLFACYESSPERLESLRRGFANMALAAYDRYCPHESGRQISEWATHRPVFSHLI